jgi:hypothetical protein
LIEDNAIKPEATVYTDILAEVPGVILESHIPAVVTPASPPEEKIFTRTMVAAQNADSDQ